MGTEPRNGPASIGGRVRMPAILAQISGGKRTFTVESSTVGEAFADLVRQRPTLRVHLFDDAGALRRYVLCFHNQETVRGEAGLRRPVAPGDSITVLSSIAGGCSGGSPKASKGGRCRRRWEVSLTTFAS